VVDAAVVVVVVDIFDVSIGEMVPMFILDRLRMGRVIVKKQDEEGENAETSGRRTADLLLLVSKEQKKPTSDIEFKCFMDE